MKHPHHIVWMLALASASCEAGEFASRVLSSECEVVSESGSTTGALVGTGVGGAVGGVVGQALFGDAGGAVGSLLGGIGGGVTGENIGAKRVYNCLLAVRDPKGRTIYVESVGRIRNPGEAVRVFVNPDGTYLVR